VPQPPAGAPAEARCRARLTHGVSAVARGDWHAAAPALRAARDLAPELDDDRDGELLLNLGVALWYLGDDRAALDLQGRLLSHARNAGAAFLVLHALTRRAYTDLVTGRWSQARAEAEESLPLAEGSGQPALVSLPHAVLALVGALRGGDPGEHLTTVERIAAAVPLGVLTGVVRDYLAWIRAVASPDAAAALHHWERIESPTVQHGVAVDRIECAVRLGRTDTAQRWLAELADFADATGAPWAVAAVHHGRALLSEGAEAEEHFRRSLAAHAESLRVPDHARTRLAFGAFLRRARRRVDAREHLRTALELFEELGADTWAERARQELRASGETARRRDAADPGPALTPTERQVAGLVREGLSKKDIAGRLFVSPRTVDFHLRNVFAKLGVTSRTELAARVGD
jgi:DNA-binding CsgD family transcriptional regulator